MSTSDAVAATGSGHGRASQADDGIDLRGLWFVFLRRRWVLASILAAGLGLTALVSMMIDTVYTAQARIILDQQSVEIMEEEGLANTVPDATVIDTQVQLIMSRGMIGRMVQDLDLTSDPEFNPVLADRLREQANSRSTAVRETVLAAMSSEPGIETETGAEPAPLLSDSGDVPSPDATGLPELANLVPPDLTPQERMELQATIASVSRAVTAYRDGLTFVIAVNASSSDPQKSALLANVLSELYINTQLETKVSQTRQAGDWLGERLGVLRDELQAAETAVEQFRIANGMVDTGGVTPVEAQIAELTAQLVILETDLTEKEARAVELRRLAQPGQIGEAILSAIDSPLITQLRAARSAASRDLADIRTTRGEAHPDTVRAEQELAELDQSISEEMSRVVARQESDLQVARNRVRDVSNKLSSLRRELDQDNVALIRLRQLEREAAARRSIYEALLTRAEEVSEQELLQSADARILSTAEAPTIPSAPNHRINFIIGALAALALAGAVIVLLELFESGYASADAVERSLGLPVLAAVAEAPKKYGVRGRKTHEIAEYMAAEPNSAFTESIRSLYAAIHRNRPKDEPMSLAVTSTLPGEGKTSLSLSLARLAASQGDKVVIVDADLRRRSITKNTGGDGVEGFREALDGKVDPRDVLVEDAKSSVMVLPAPTPMEGHMSVILKPACKTLFDNLKRDYDLVIIDCPPVLPVMEARTIASSADGTIYAMRWRATHQKAIRQGVKALLTEGATILGGMLTRTNLKTLSLYDELGPGHYKKYAAYYKN